MSRRKYIFATSVAVFCAYCGVSQSAVMSKYGEIQPVNKYSSNPFWTPDSPYNLRFPSPIYATGPDLNTETCNNTVAALVNSYCSANNNCSKLQVSDVRPKIMVQLSQLPGHNYATSCGGYIDNAVKEYKKNHGNSFSGINVVQQPKTTKPLSLTGVVTSQPKTKSDGVAERTAELEQVQSMTTQTIDVAETDFPKTIADLSFVDRVANTTAGYEPYKNLKSYKIPEFEREDQYYERMRSQLEHNINYETYGGNPKSKSPTKYLTGKGAKITWHPTRDEYSTFKGWCGSEDLTLNPTECEENCPMEPTIDPMSKSDKSFYACWECDATHPMVRDHYCECPDKKHMNEKCECLPKNITKLDGDKCVCNDTTLDIDSGCKCLAGSHMTQDPTTGMCACRDPYENDPSNPSVCKCKDPNGDPNNGCNVPPPEPCLDPNMNPDCASCKDTLATIDPSTNTCKCPLGYEFDADGVCQCSEPIPIMYPKALGCRCSDSNASIDPGTNKCKCPDGSRPKPWTGFCDPPDDGSRFVVMQCRPTDVTKIPHEGDHLPLRFNPEGSRHTDCANIIRNMDLLEACFTECRSAAPSSYGAFNTNLPSISFCTGRVHYSGYGEYFFGKLDTPIAMHATPLEFTRAEIDQIKAAASTTRASGACCDPRRDWYIYILKIEGSGYTIESADDIIQIGNHGCS